MASNKAITDDFKKLLSIISNWYDQHGYISMLKVLYRDCVNNIGNLCKASGTIELLNLLITSGKLHSQNLSVLYDTIKATETYGLINEIKPKIPSCPNVRDEKISQFTSHRQKVMKLGMALRDDDIETISKKYNKSVKNYKDTWSLIMDLEHRMIIHEKKMKAFIDQMKILELFHAVKALTEDISIASSNTVVGFGEEIDDNDLQQLLEVFMDWYDQDKLEYTSMLKVLYRDLIKNTQLLNRASNTNELMNLLSTSGNLHSTVLNATIETTDTLGLKLEIEQKIPSWPKLRDESIFSPHRRKLMKLGMVLVDNDIKMIKGLHSKKLKAKDYLNTWNLIMDLEHQMIICDGKMDAFIHDLKELKLPLAVNALTEDIPTTSSDSGKRSGKGSGKQQTVKRKRLSSDSKVATGSTPENFQGTSNMEVPRHHDVGLVDEGSGKQQTLKLKRLSSDSKDTGDKHERHSSDFEATVMEVPRHHDAGLDKGSGGKKKQKRIRPSSDSEEEIDTKTESSSATVEGTSKSLSKGHHEEHDIGSGHGLTDVAFKELLTVFSEWYDQRGYLSMLKVLYRDLVDARSLFTASKTMDLMYLLMARGELDSTNLKIIYDTIKSTDTYGLGKKIKSQIPSCPNIRDVIISEFTPHRQKIMKFGMALMDDDIVKISELYNKPVKEYADTWSLIMDLEHQMVISEAKNEDFIEHLKKNGLHQAVNALTEVEGIRVSVKRKRDSDLKKKPGTCAHKLLMELEKNRGSLTVSDIQSFQMTFKSIRTYFQDHGLNLFELEEGSIKFCMIAPDFQALQKLRKLQGTGELRKDLLTILLPEEHQQEDLDDWMTYINENEFKATLSLSKQKEKGNGKRKYKRKRHSSDSEGASGEKVQCIRNSSDSEDIQNASSKSREDVKELSDIDFGVLKKFFSEWYESKSKATLSLSKQEGKGTSKTLSKGHHEEHDIGSGHGITDNDFENLLSIFSKYYDERGYVSMLKVLYRDNVANTHRLYHASKTSILLDLLSDTGALDLEEYSILCETIKATQTFGLEKKIKHLIPSCPNIRDVTISNFTTHRQGVIKLGMALSDQDIDKISGIYNDPIKDYADPWSLIMDLEHRTIICEKNMEKFIENLKKFELNHAVKVLTEELSEMEFNLLKTIVSNWYGGESNVSMLKVLFADKVEKGNLSSVTSTIDLLNNLFTSDHLSSWNLGLLCDTISITNHFALQWEIKKKLPSFPEVKKGTISTEFTPHRQKLMKFGFALTTDNVKEIDGLYNTLPKMYTSSWIMITDLEDRLIISEGNLKKFIDRLRTSLNLQQALNTLAEVYL